MSTRWDEFELKRKMLQEEYAILALQWRFLQGVRMAIVIAVAAAQATLFTTYRVFLMSVAAGTARPFDRTVLFALALTGILITYATILVGHNLVDTIRGTLRRGINLEDQCGIIDGMYQHAVIMDFGDGKYWNVSTVMRIPLAVLEWVWRALIGLALLTIFGAVS